ncbi:SxtJ family membrane protein [Cohaesibacter gelatinilyticus]|uniref:SxtJ n=1 Tax=Cohaesibacter gelatinilyticus TaxID=372072 RepID=A0A285NHQ3_9HYPH|nr:SxtJ family membrane protein [Cohaesibacter gelatinilyticus]SNZ07406.1 hypothetical protein SAMN06265368_0925 [Cohaesibacter gelatinilyticus]
MLDKEIPLPSNRKFGYFFAIIFICLSAYLFWSESNMSATVSVVLAAGFGGLASVAPDWLTLPNKLWFKFGILLSKIVSPIVLGFIFFLLITPIALVTKIFGRDELRLKRRNVSSHWIIRNPVGPEPNSFKNQH